MDGWMVGWIGQCEWVNGWMDGWTESLNLRLL